MQGEGGDCVAGVNILVMAKIIVAVVVVVVYSSGVGSYICEGCGGCADVTGGREVHVWDCVDLDIFRFGIFTIRHAIQ